MPHEPRHPSGVALLTLFDEDGGLLIEETAWLAGRLCDSGADTFLVAGTAGEFWAVDDDERIALVAAVRATVPPQAGVLAHVGGVDTRRGGELTRACTGVGADAVVALPMGVENVAAYYAALVDAAGDLPVFAYHLPGLGTPVPVDLISSLGVSGIKDSSGDGPRLVAEVLTTGVAAWTGAPALLSLAGQLGAAGALTGVANVRPEWCAAAWGGDAEAQIDVARLHMETEARFPVLLKGAAAARWGTPAHSRQP